jgi:UDP-2,4-diacetamido-2,4,6-trideoxy-beta-L-altropyranose hydrolase
MILIRADASTQIGVGHIMRCLTLADSLRNHGCDVIFMCQELLGNLCDFLEEKEFQVCRIAIDNQKTESLLQLELSQITNIINQSKLTIDWLIIDHYKLDVKWESKIRPFVSKIMVIDDLANRVHDCDLLLDQNPYNNYKNRYQHLVSTSCLQLLGLDYLLLRSEFTNKSNPPKQKTAIAQNILITMGGTDSRNITCWLIEALEYLRIPLSIRIVVGAGCPHINKIKLAASKATLHEISVERSVTNISELMIWSDLAICAGGFTTYELAFMGVPTIVISASDTQLEAAIALHQLGITKFIGEFGNISMSSTVSALSDMIFNSEKRIELSHSGKAKIDGYGVNRVVENLLKEVN